MSPTNDSHIVEIPVDQEHQLKLSGSVKTMSAIEQHPLNEISASPGHLLLLKLWQREEELNGKRVVLKESRMDSMRQQLFNLCCFFFIFHAFFFTILFTSSQHNQTSCTKWWIPSALNLCASLFIAFLVQVKLFWYWKFAGQLGKERSNGRALTRCIQELRMKGATFDLSKEPYGNGKKMKSSSVEIKWKPVTWCTHYFVTVCLVCFSGLAFPACKCVLCGI